MRGHSCRRCESEPESWLSKPLLGAQPCSCPVLESIIAPVVFWALFHPPDHSQILSLRIKKNGPRLCPPPFNSHTVVGLHEWEGSPWDLWKALILHMLSKALVCLCFTHGSAAEAARVGLLHFCSWCVKSADILCLLLLKFSQLS